MQFNRKYKIEIPSGARFILDELWTHGFGAYIVGGCVRDSILGMIPKDWDICTSAAPDQVEFCFRNHKIIETGLKHGTVTVIVDGCSYEVTTYRTDGKYSDHRHPDSVTFVSSLEMDLARRDFTMNAIAYAPHTGLVDPFDGIKDIQNKTIRCVGNPDERLTEDPLRILRALRFASTYGFNIDTETTVSMKINRFGLKHVSKERIRDELCKMIVGRYVLPFLEYYSEILVMVIPELNPCIGFVQNNPYHCYTVYDHIAHAVANYQGDDVVVKMALLLHDIGKPECYTEDEKGGHFRGHAPVSARIAQSVLEDLRFDNKTKNDIVELVLYHDAEIKPTPRVVRKWLNKVGEENFRRMIQVRLADIGAHMPGTQAAHLMECIEVNTILTRVLEEHQCFTLKDLHINGDDIINLGVLEGKAVGEILNYLLDEVIAGNIPNKHHDLTLAADLEIYRRSLERNGGNE